MPQKTCILLMVAFAAGRASAQMDHDMSKMGMMDMDPAGNYLMRLASGTSANPESWPMPMIMAHRGEWSAMFMGTAFLSDIQQSAPRGGDKLYSTNWFMAALQHPAGKGAFQVDLMLSLEPATIADRRYPLLFQTGETAYGHPLVDAQHPHNLVMALGLHYARSLGEHTILDLYAAPVGDPALGPVAFPHRASAAEFPEAPISHHLEDSTHIADEVVTAGLQYRKIKLEASGFHGAEPGENRWIIQAGALDSWSTRFWFFPGKNWAAQVSYGRLTHPEALEPGNQSRATASLSYTRPLGGRSWSSSLIWGRTHNSATFHNLNSYLAESVYPVTRRNFIAGRIELLDKDELGILPGNIFRIGAYTLGYTRDVDLFPKLETGVGANFTTYSLPDLIKPYYGARPVGGNIFVRFRLKPKG